MCGGRKKNKETNMPGMAHVASIAITKKKVSEERDGAGYDEAKGGGRASKKV